MIATSTGAVAGFQFSGCESTVACQPIGTFDSRGWALLEEDGSLRGHIYFHLGDVSGFRAVREKT